MSAELHTLVGAYALDALDPRERAAFEDHLHGCPTCSAELREFQATAARLGDAAAEPPPARLREDVLAAARRTRQLRPAVTVVPLSRWRRRAPALLAAAALLVAVGVGGMWWAEHDRNNDQDVVADEMAEVMTAPDVVSSPRGESRVPVRVYSSESLDQAVVVVDDLPDIDNDQSYELWALDPDGTPRSLGVMSDSSGSGQQLIDGLGDATGVAVTVEEAGGSPSGLPTTDPVAQVRMA
jgi:anti-sigma-K factor RskA